MLLALLQGIIDGFAKILNVLIAMLPLSPFDYVSGLTIDNKIMSWIAWLFPIRQMVVLLEGWGVAIALYYVVMVKLRFVKILE